MPKEPLYPHVPKSRQPKFPHVKGRQPAEKLPQTLPQTGTCYADAWRFLIKEEEGELIHGSVTGADGKTVKHAWVETLTGYVWEPETGRYFTRLGFEDAFAPVIESRYTAEEAAIMAARTKHFGPWSTQERLSYLGRWRVPETIGLLASIEDIEPVSPQYRHLVGLVSEPLPKEAE